MNTGRVWETEVGERSRGWQRDFNMGRELCLKFYRCFNSVKLRSMVNDLAVWPISIRSYPYRQIIFYSKDRIILKNLPSKLIVYYNQARIIFLKMIS